MIVNPRLIITNGDGEIAPFGYVPLSPRVKEFFEWVRRTNEFLS